MKKFSKITGQKVAEEPKVEIKITEADIFKSKVLSLMDHLLRVQIYGPITRYHVAGTMKVAGKELFLEALMDLLNDKSKGDKITLLESLKTKIQDWETIDETIDSIKSIPSEIYKQKNSIKSLYNKWKDDENILLEKTNKSAEKITDIKTLQLKKSICESMSNDENFDVDILNRMARCFQIRIQELNS